MRGCPSRLALDVQTRLIYNERVLALAEDGLAMNTAPDQPARGEARGRPTRVIRHVMQAASAINGEKGEIRPMTAMLRPEVSLLLAERSRDEGPVVIVSPAGPLTRDELQVVQGVGDPLAIAEILPSGAVSVGAILAGGRGGRAGDQRV